MHARPQGIVTFLFTDIEGSTRLWERHPAAMEAAFAQQERIIRESCAGYGGFVYKMIGDAFQVAFATASDALLAALAAQRGLVGATWDETGPLRVRMALHSGRTEERGDDYVGPILNRLGRLLAAGAGGQILLSQDCAALLREALPPEVTLRDLGAHRLKDLVRPERIFQAAVADLPQTFPALKTINDRPPLPVPATPFIGREAELAAATQLFADPACRLVTLVGPGGVGKTRLALQIAQQDVFVPEGSVFVALAEVNSRDELIVTLGSALGYTFQAQGDPVAQLCDHLRNQAFLLVLDNFEQILDQAALVGEILASASRIKILATSRERLGLQSEWIMDLPGLALPVSAEPARVEVASAVRLFLQSARRIQRDFALTAAEIPAIIRICQLVEGMPLALELAASWLRVLSCDEIAGEIDRHLGCLTTTLRDMPPRHRSMRALFEQSWILLSHDEQLVLQALSVFAGGADREAAEQVAQADLAILASLTDKSLLRRDHGRRYVLHGLIRQYAAEQLQAAGAIAGEVHARHCAHYASLIQQPLDKEYPPDLPRLLSVIGNEIDNMRAAWRWAIKQRNPDIIRQLLEGLFHFYHVQGWFQEGRETFSQAGSELRYARDSGEIDQSQFTDLAGRLLIREGTLITVLGAFAQAKERLNGGIELLRSGNHIRELSFALRRYGYLATHNSDYPEAKRALEESLLHSQALGYQPGIAKALDALGYMEAETGNYAEARRLIEEGLALVQRYGGNQMEIAYAYNSLGYVTYLSGDYPQAATLLAEGLKLRRAIGYQFGVGVSLINLAYVATATNAPAQARTYFHEALQTAFENNATPIALAAIAGLALACGRAGDSRRAIELLSLVRHHPSAWQETVKYALAALPELEAALPPSAVASAQAQGRAQTWEAVAELLLSEAGSRGLAGCREDKPATE